MRKGTDNLETAVVAVRVITRARKDEIVAIMDDGTLKIRLAAPPVEGKANKALVAFLSEVAGVPRNQIEILRGSKSRNKLLSFQNITSQMITERIKEQISSG